MADAVSTPLRASSIGLHIGRSDCRLLVDHVPLEEAPYVEISVYVYINSSPTKNQRLTNVFPTFLLGLSALVIQIE
jgi:hypothetical protein